MKRKFLVVASALVLIITMTFTLASKTGVVIANAGSSGNVLFQVYLENLNYNLDYTEPIIANKQVGIYFDNYPTNCKILLKGTDGCQLQKDIINNRVEIPIKNDVTFSVYLVLDSPIIPPLDIGISITYDTEKPQISASTERNEIKNGDTIIGKSVKVKANDNFRNVKLCMFINGEEEVLCDETIYTVSSSGTYTFYAVDVAGNYSEDFTITYYDKAPEKEPESPPISTAPDDSEQSVPDDNTQTDNRKPVNQTLIIIAVVVFSVLLGGVVFIIIYKKEKAKTAQFDDDE